MIHDARKVALSSSNPVFFDANVWLSIYAPPSKEDEYWKGEYTKVLNRIVNGKVPVLLDATVVSEYINRYCRIEFEAYMGASSKLTFKQFRESRPDYYRPIAKEAADYVKEILDLPLIKRVNGDFEAMDLPGMLADFEQGESDWNDQQIVDLCQRNKCSLLTNDADFRDATDVNILTCNGKLLGLVNY